MTEEVRTVSHCFPKITTKNRRMDEKEEKVITLQLQEVLRIDK